MRFPLFVYSLSALLLAGCHTVISNATLPLSDTAVKNYDKQLAKLEQQAVDKHNDSLGTPIGQIDFKVKTTNLADYQDGYIPWIELEHPEHSLNNLADKDRVVISQKKVTIVIDYPVTHEYRFTLTSDTGFNKTQLVTALSFNYGKLYRDEEATATIKTIPAAQRKTLANRNKTNGKYGIWGHDMADLMLAGIVVYQAQNGDIILSLDIES